MKIKTIFLDMDDVLNCFTMSALREVGCPVGPYSFDKYKPKGSFDIIKAANILHPDSEHMFTASNFWRSLKRKFWATIPASKELPMLLEQCEKLVGKENICILTNPVQEWYPYVAAAKMEWIGRFLPSWLHKQFLIGLPKHFCARPDALLIDDSDSNVNVFWDYGGQAILVPRPWNSLHRVNTEKYLLGVFHRFSRRKEE